MAIPEQSCALKIVLKNRFPSLSPSAIEAHWRGAQSMAKTIKVDPEKEKPEVNFVRLIAVFIALPPQTLSL